VTREVAGGYTDRGAPQDFRRGMSPASRRLQLRQRHRRRSHRAADVVRPCASRRELSVVRTRADTAPKVGAPLRLAA